MAVVTGGASGIGLAIARKMAAEGAHLVIADLNFGAAKLIAEELAGNAVEADVSREPGVKAMVEAAVAARGRLDILVNNAGVGTEGKRLADCDEDEWDRVVRIDLTSVFLCMKAALPALRASGYGSIVNVASVAAIVAWRGTAPYTAAKGGVAALTRATAAEYARLGVRVNCLCPGVTETPLMERATGG
ncbi:MAG: SDR family oxidoreductase, partial [Dehalococcoidia bacterium]